MAKTKRKARAAWPAAAAAITIVLAAIVMLAVLLWKMPEEDPVPTTDPVDTPAATVPRSRLSPEDFVEENGYISCLTAETVLGIDVSHHQQTIDWQQVKNAGIQFVMIRLGYRGISDGSLNTDRFAAENLAGAREAGLWVGAYFYSQATSVAEAEEEARYALQVLGDFKLDLPLAYDWEIESRTENVDVQTATDCAAAFCGIIEAAGCDAMIYFNGYQAQERLDLKQLTAYPWWLAMYSPGSDFPCRFDIWQYTQTGSVPGIEGNVDINIRILGEKAG